MRKFRSLVLSLMFAGMLIAQAGAQTYKVAIVQLATTETFQSLAKAISDETNITFEIQVVPAARALYLVENSQVDAMMPRSVTKESSLVKNPKIEFSSASLYTTAYVLYTNKAKAVDIADLRKGNTKGFKIETNAANVGQFEFEPLPSTNLEASLKKVDSGVIDGYIYSMVTTDTALKSLGLKSIKRQLYADFELSFALPKGKRGGALDKILSDGMKKLRANGSYDKIMGALIKQGKYDDWQP